MGMFKEHLIAGTAAGLATGTGALYMYGDPKLAGFLCAVTVAGSLVSDVDTGSVPSRIFAWIGIAVSILLLYQGNPVPAAYIGIIYMLFSSDKHRGFTHKWILPIGCFIALLITKQMWLGAFAIGLGTHYAVDKIPPYKII